MTDTTPLIFLNANVLFTAAHKPNGKSALLVELANQGYWRIITSSLAVEEAQRNLVIKFPAFMYRLKALIDCITVAPSVFGAPCPISLPEKDRAIFLTGRFWTRSGVSEEPPIPFAEILEVSRVTIDLAGKQ